MSRNSASSAPARPTLDIRALVMLALILTIFAAAQTAYAEVADFYLSFKDGKLYENSYLDGKEYTTGKGATWSATSNTLTLNDFAFTTTAKYGLVLGSNDLVLTYGTANLIQCVGGSGVSADNQTTALLCGNTTFSGGGILYAKGGSPAFPAVNSVYGISGSRLKFEDCTVYASCANANDASYAIYCYTAFINGAKIYATSGVGKSGSYGVYALGRFAFNNGVVTATGDSKSRGSLKNAAIYVDASNGLAIGGATILTAIGGNYTVPGRVGDSQPPQYTNNVVVNVTGVISASAKLIIGADPPPTPVPTPTDTPRPTPRARLLRVE